jgi:acyl-CoA reductase-like NAD-dependent aldehyde dehydrogenase
MGLELGGKDPAYVLADANRPCDPNLVEGAFFNSGQCCCGIERVYVHEKVYDEFVEGFEVRRRNYKLGNPLDPRPRWGRWRRRALPISSASRQAEALRKGATAHHQHEGRPTRRARPISPPRC